MQLLRLSLLLEEAAIAMPRLILIACAIIMEVTHTHVAMYYYAYSTSIGHIQCHCMLQSEHLDSGHY